MKTRLRIQKIEIEIPKEDKEIWVHVTTEKIIEDDEGNVISTSPRSHFISRPFSKFMSEIYQYEDPILGKEETDISGLGLNLAIRNAAIKWIAEDSGGIIDGGKVWLS